MRRHLPILAIFLCLTLTTALLLAVPGALRYTFPAIVTMCAALIFRRSRTTYISFCLWLWFLAPLLRRLVDWRTEFVATSPLLTAPFLAVSVSGVVLLSNLRSLSRRNLAGAIPFACALLGILFGTLYGLTRYDPVDVARAIINWFAPILFAFFLYSETRDNPTRFHQYRDTFLRTLLWGTLLLGLYGILQFFFLLPWDESWMRGINNGAFGQPFPRELRVFSTMNAPATFASYLMAGILIAFTLLTQTRNTNTRTPLLAAFAAPVGVLALALTTSRALWLGLVFGILYLALTLPGRARVRVVATVLVAFVVAAIAVQAPAINHVVVSRLKSFTSGTSDVSVSARIYGHSQALSSLAAEPLGEGLGSTDVDHATDGSDDRIGPHDSTLLEFLFSLGAPGSLIYAIGIASALIAIFLLPADTAGIALKATLVAFFSESLLNSILIGVPGFLVWSVIAFLLAQKDLVNPLTFAAIAAQSPPRSVHPPIPAAAVAARSSAPSAPQP
jgi:hypothetical protein